jgi:hypothetical protein
MADELHTLHTQGGQIVDARSYEIVLTGVSWFGLEIDTFAPHGLDRRVRWQKLNQMAGLGFDTFGCPSATRRSTRRAHSAHMAPLGHSA